MTADRRFGLSCLYAVFLAGLIAACLPAAAYAKTATTTTLKVTPVCLNEGCVVTMTATIVAGSTPVHPGLVYFCDGTSGKDCEYGLPVGQAQAAANGTATIKRVLTPGQHYLYAVFHGTATYASSTSSSQVLALASTDNPATVTTIYGPGPAPAATYQVAALVSATGIAPATGSIKYIDTTNSNTVVATSPITPEPSNSSVVQPQISYNSGGLDLSEIPANLVSSVTATATADINNDGFQDVVTLSSAGLKVLLGNGKVGFTLAPSSANTVGTSLRQVLVADFNGDGKLDVAVPDYSTSKIYVSLGNGDGSFTDAAPIQAASGPYSLLAGDFNNDGVVDLVAICDGASAGTYFVETALGHGDGTFTSPEQAFSFGYSSSVQPLSPGGSPLAVADFDQDGNQDIAVEDGTNGYYQGKITVLHGNGDGTFRVLPNPTAVRNSDGDMVVADFNDDGIPDLAFAYENADVGGGIDLHIGKGNGTFIAQTGYSTNSSPIGVKIADFNGDGILDLALVTQFNPGQYVPGANTYLQVYTGYLDSVNGYQAIAINGNLPTDFSANAANSVWALADFSGDGVPDVIDFDGGTYGPLTFVDALTTYSLDDSPTIPASLFAGAGLHNIVGTYSGDSYHKASISLPVQLAGVGTLGYENGFTSSAGLSLNSGATIQDGALQLVDGKQFESRSAFAANRLPLYTFNTSFDFQIATPSADGLAFVFQSNGPNAVGTGGGGLGYGTAPGATSGPSIVNSAALLFDLHNNQGEGANSVRTETGGVTSPAGAVDLTPSGIDLHSGHKFRAQISYTYNALDLTLTDLTTNAQFTHTFAVDLFKALLDTTGYVGFTSGTGATAATVNILNWQFSGQGCCSTSDFESYPLVELPSFANGFAAGSNMLQLNNGAQLSGSALELTNNTRFQATSAYFTPPVITNDWTTDFDFTISGAGGDGFTFVLQDQGLNAVGLAGGGLGYGPSVPGGGGASIDRSIAIKFDVHNNAGEGPNSTGLYLNGASPTVPAVDLYPSHIVLDSGHAFHARICQSGSNIYLSITDLTNYAVFTDALPLGYASLNQGYVGFTAGNGNTANTVKILNWVWSNYDVDID